MTTSIDLSVDELLLLQENQTQLSNFAFTNIKPIGAERKIGLPTNVSNQIKSSLPLSQRLLYPMDIDFGSKDIEENNNYLNSFEIPSSTSFDSSLNSSAMSIYDHCHFSPFDEPLIIPQTKNEIERLTHHPFHNYSTIHSSSHLFENYNYQRQISSTFIQQKFIQSPPIKTIPSFCATQIYPSNRFSSQYYSREPFINIYQQTRSIPPVFSAPLQSTRERFQVNSIGRPILRTNNYNHLSHIHHFKIRR